MNQKSLAIFDVDGTQFKSACVEKVIDEAIRQKVFDKELFVEAMARRRLWQANNNEGVYQSYLHHLVGGFVTSIAGVEVGRFRAITAQMVADHQVRLFGYTRKLAQLLGKTHHLIAISGSPLPVVEPFLDGLGFDQIFGSTFEVEDGRFTGEAKSIHKETVLDEVTSDGHHISVGIGDTVGDLPVLNRAECSIAFNPSATLRNRAIAEGWFIVTEQKDAVTQLLPVDGGYQVHFERSPEVILRAAGIIYE